MELSPKRRGDVERRVLRGDAARPAGGSPHGRADPQRTLFGLDPRHKDSSPNVRYSPPERAAGSGAWSIPPVGGDVALLHTLLWVSSPEAFGRDGISERE